MGCESTISPVITDNVFGYETHVSVDNLCGMVKRKLELLSDIWA